MTFSQTRSRLAIGGVITMAVIAKLILVFANPSHAIALALVIAVATVSTALGLIAFFSRDEVQRQNTMKSWYWGGPAAIFLLVLPFILFSSDTAIVAWVGYFEHVFSGSAAQQSPKAIFSLGVAFAVIAQVLGYYVARLALRLRS